MISCLKVIRIYTNCLTLVLKYPEHLILVTLLI